MVAELGGVIDASCPLDFDAFFTAIGDQLFTSPAYLLSAIPDDPAALGVYVDVGSGFEAFTGTFVYDETDNAIRFAQGSVVPAGADIEVRYDATP